MFTSNRRSTKGDHDAILDVLTNVVGILVIFIAAARLVIPPANASDPTLSPLTVQVVDEARGEADAARARLAALRQRWGQLETAAPTGWLLADHTLAANRALAAELAEPTDFASAGAILEEESAALQGDLTRAEAQVQLLSNELSRLDRLLDETRSQAEQQNAVRLPRPDPSKAENKSIYRFYCRDGQVFPVDEPSLDALLFKTIGEVVGKSGRVTYEDVGRHYGAISRRFAGRQLGNEFFSLTTSGEYNSARSFYMRAGYALRSDARGTDLDALAEPESLFGRTLDELDPGERWCLFLVWDDSFEVYLKAREIAESAGFAVGPALYAEDEEFSWSLAMIGFSQRGGSIPVVPD